MKKLVMVLFVLVVFALPALAENRAKDFSEIGRDIDSKVVTALAEGSDGRCPNFMFGDQELVKRRLREVVTEEGNINNNWFMDITSQSQIINLGIRSIVGLPPQEGVARIEIHYDSGLTRIITISREGGISCRNGSELLKK